MELKGFYIGGCIVIAENEEEAMTMYKDKWGSLWEDDISHKITECNLDEHFMYFNIKDIKPEDYEYIYDRRYPNYPSKDIELVSLKRPHAKKYSSVLDYDTKKIIEVYY